MLSKLEMLLLASIFSFTLLLPLTFALTFFAVTECSPCDTNSCVCPIEGCSSGILRIYSSSTCRGIPKYEYTFSSYQFRWSNAPLGTYYFKGFCTDDRTTSCAEFTVRASGATTTTRPSTTTTAKGKCTSNSDCPAGQECVSGTCKPIEKKDYTWAFVVLAVVLVIFVLLFLFFRVFKKKPQKTFEDIYRKWRR
jgi:hypothetical protein